MASAGVAEVLSKGIGTHSDRDRVPCGLLPFENVKELYGFLADPQKTHFFPVKTRGLNKSKLIAW